MAKHKTIKPVDLEKALNEILTEYGNEVDGVINEAVDQVVKESVQKLHSAGSFGGTGAYKAGWDSTTQQKSRLKAVKVVHNADHYRLTHLLEHGHVIRNGTGRTFGNAPAFPHIKDVEDWAVEELPKKVEELLNR